MPTLKVGARDVVAYDDVGQGPLVVLIHGSPGTSRVWQPVAERLAPRFRVIAPSLPGYGGTTAPPDGARGDNSYAAELIEALVAEVGRPAAFAGYSYGGVARSGPRCAGRSDRGRCRCSSRWRCPSSPRSARRRRSPPPGRYSRTMARPSTPGTAWPSGRWWTTGSARPRSTGCPRRCANT